MNVSQMKRVYGFTLIELMVALAIAAILLTVGIPTFQDFIANQRARTVAQDLVVVLLQARSEAVKRNVNVLLSISRDSSNNLLGWAVTSDTTKDYNACVADPTNCLRIQAALGGITLTNGGTSIIFQSSGRLTAPLATPFDICLSRANQRQVRVDSMGSPVISKTSVVCP